MNSKITILTIILCAAAANVFAQVQKGDSNIGANMSLSTDTGVDAPTTNFTLVLSYQYFITDNISLGFGPSFSTSVNKQDLAETWTDAFGLNLFGNYNFLTSGGKALPYIGAQFTLRNLYSGTDTFDANGVNTSTDYTDITTTSFGVNGGLKYFITERVNIDGNLSYTSNLSITAEVNGSTFEPDVEGGLLQFTIGLGIILGKRG